MAKLTTAQRKNISKSQFGLPGKAKKGTASKGAFPMTDRAHAANAKARAVQGVKAGTLSPSAKAKIFRKANKILGKKK